MITLLLGACSPKYYVANTQNVPLISKKGETNLTFSGNGDQVEFQGAYGVTDNFSIMLNSGFFIPADLDDGNGGSGRLIELGAGYSKPVDTHFVFETYGIFGFGNFENHMPSTVAANPQTTGDISTQIMRYGIQPNFGYKSKYFTAAISSRFVNLNYSNVEGDLIFDGVSQTDYLNNHNSNFLIEPALTLRGGFEKIKLQLQYIYSFNLTNSDFNQEHSYLTAGINFNFK